MKFLHFVFFAFLLSMIASCDKNDGDIYPYPDNTSKADNDTVTPDKDTVIPDKDIHEVDEDNDESLNDEETDDFLPDDNPDFEEPDDTDLPDNEIPDIDNYVPFGCGNGKKEPGEDCDNGSFNSDDPGQVGVTCRTNCKYAKCGDGVKDQFELCDDGNNDNGDYCSADCSTIAGKCGDGIVQTNEACDKSPAGNGIGAYCNDDCTEISGSCGDGIVQDNEICDKAEFGDGTGPFYCAADCKKIIGSCGDGTPQANESCDDGGNNGRYGYCNATCTGPGKRCGDGTVDWEGDEICDDGNTEDGDYCSADCMTLFGRCGDGIKQAFEECDNATYGEGTGLYCSYDCKTVLGTCGDEILQDHEQCDRGIKNISQYCEYGEEPPCERCNTVCNLMQGTPTFCGDGRIDLQNGEKCDKAEPDVGEGTGTGGYCSFDCKETLGSCGDGIKQDFEACDKADFNQGIGSEYCSDDCTAIIGFCGDGVPQSNEMCDLGVNNTEYCTYGQTSCLVCNSECQEIEGITSLCGDSKTDAHNGEICDSGSNNGKYFQVSPGYCNSDCKGRGSGGFCGDGTTHGEHGEECDEGEGNGQTECEYGQTSCDLCSTSCKTVAGAATYCGDGIPNGPEKCDDGGNNGKYGFCKSDCTGIGPYCGDGQKTDDEVCDDGEDNGKYGFCAFDCKSEGKRCGDGVTQPEEICDSGEENNGVYRPNAPGNCNSDCKGVGDAGYCGNSSVETPFEECDHGGIIKTDCEYGETSCKVCTVNCEEIDGKTSYCGDGQKDELNGEICDDGDKNGDYGFCKDDCSGAGPYCGDGDKTDGEQCDDGEDNGKYGFCKNDCSGIGPHCGDGLPNGNEICDNGINNGNYGFCKDDCTGTGEHCGDGIENGDEQCDDGDDNGSYGFCKDDCTGVGPYCGDGETTDEEGCDDGEDNGKYGFCKIDCSEMNLSCGDGYIQTEEGEECDDGDDNGKYGFCKIDCSGPGEHCGDGIKNGDEECDDGESNGDYGLCKEDCSGITYCGDGQVDGTEVCDNGADNGKYGLCKTDCSGVGPHCGDGIKQSESGETCDDGLSNGTPGKCNSTCTGAHEWCGDGIQNGDEDCDNGSNNGQTHCTYGLTSCTVCSEECVSSAGITAYCGDTIQNGTEACDSGSNNGKNGYCKSDCTGMVEYCGDGIVQSGEVCDSGDMNGLYNSNGVPYCNTDCQDSGEGGFCGDGDVQEDFEDCDEGENNGLGTCLADCKFSAFCGNGYVESGELCDTSDVSCSDFAQFDSGMAACNEDCLPDFSTCSDNVSYSSPFFTTSLTNCYNNSGVISCPNEDDPFYGQEPQFDYKIQNFTVNADTIYESTSGLMWQKDTPELYSGCTAGSPAGSECAVKDAWSYCDNLDLGGHDDWRMPHIFEFYSLLDFTKSAPMVFSEFTNSTSFNYWSLSYLEYLVSTVNGVVTKAEESSLGHVKCVRGENKYENRQIFQSGNLFLDVLDESEPEIVVWQYDSAQIAVNWEDALFYCSNITDNGVSGFRLPTVIELQFFVFESVAIVPPLIDAGNFWTSTTVHADTMNAYTVDFGTGNVNMNGKTGTNFVICVK